MSDFMDALFGLNGTPRYQTWPERALRAGPEWMQQGMEGGYNPPPANPGTLTEEDVARQRWGQNAMTDKAFDAAGSAMTGNLAAGGALPKDALGALFLKRIETTSPFYDRSYHVVDEGGVPKLYAHTNYDPTTKDVYVADIGPLGAEVYTKDMANKFGPTDIRSLVQALKQEYPDATAVKGYRVTGAKAESSLMHNKGYYPMVRVPLPK